MHLSRGATQPWTERTHYVLHTHHWHTSTYTLTHTHSQTLTHTLSGTLTHSRTHSHTHSQRAGWFVAGASFYLGVMDAEIQLVEVECAMVDC